MKTQVLIFFFLLVKGFAAFSQMQQQTQYFDGADTSTVDAILISIDTSSSNVWQVGKPQKTIFNSAATDPNVMITDTINSYPVNNRSSFQFTYQPLTSWGILALQWKQKLDMEQGKDGGIIEFSVDNGTTWQNAFNNPHVYNFYGYNSNNKDTLATGEYAFSGKDTTWRDVWLCFDMTWLSWNTNVLVRFTLLSDSTDTQQEGWMIDNMMTHLTVFHTAIAAAQTEYMRVYPNPATHLIYIEAQKIQAFHIIEKMTLKDTQGKIIEEWENIPTRYFIDSRKYSSGLYYLTIKTNIRTEIVPIAIVRNE